MNERIRDLLPNPFAVDYQAENAPLDLYTEKEMLKFAELIVRECISQVAMIGISNSDNDNYGDIGWTVQKSIEQIRTHFRSK